MKSLYEAGSQYSNDALSLEEEVGEKVREAFAKYIGLGYPPHEIAHIIFSCVISEECYHTEAARKTG
jgi:hypothetical protein